MIDLPLFPLNTVLFPGMPLSLHIFEERYKQMINVCISEKQPFGVVLIAEGTEALGPLAQPNMVGTTARITQVQPLVQGRINLIAIGQERFRVLELDRDSQPYLTGKVDLVPLPIRSRDKLQAQSDRLREHVMRYLEVLTRAGDVQFDLQQLPEDPLLLAYLAAFIVRTDADKKQNLLESASADQLTARLRALYSTENALLEAMIEHSEKDSNSGGFSLN